MKSGKVILAEGAAQMVQSGDTLAVTGDGYLLLPDRVLEALEKRFLASGAPRELTEFHPVIVGRAGGGGLDRLSHKGMVRRFIGTGYSIWGMDRMNSLIDAGDVEAYVLPMGNGQDRRFSPDSRSISGRWLRGHAGGCRPCPTTGAKCTSARSGPASRLSRGGSPKGCWAWRSPTD